MRIEHILSETQLNELGTGPGINPALQARLDARRQARAAQAGGNPPAPGTPPAPPAAPGTPPAAPADPPSDIKGPGIFNRLGRGVERVNKGIHKLVGKIPGIGSSIADVGQPAAAPGTTPAAPGATPTPTAPGTSTAAPAATPATPGANTAAPAAGQPGKTPPNKSFTGSVRPAQEKATQQNLNDYFRGVASALNSARDPAQKRALTKELVNYMADRKNYPEWQAALPAVKSLLKRTSQNPAFTQQAIANVESGKLMAEAWQMDYINQLLEAVNLTWKDLGLTVVEDSETHKFNIFEAASYDAELNDMLSLTRRLIR